MNRIINLAHNRLIAGCRFIATKITADGKEVPKTKNFAHRITLISTDNSVSITDLKQAQNLCNKRELKLVKIQDADAKSRRPIYKMMTNSEYLAEELERRKSHSSRQNSTIKGEKLVTLSARIGEHDLMTNVKKMMKLLAKQYEVRVIISGNSAEETQATEQMFSVIEKSIKAIGKVVQKRNKGNSLRFQLLPVISAKSDSLLEDCKNHSTSNPNDGDAGPL